MKNWLTNIKRIVKWLPVLWRDREWDYAFILEILRHRIQLHREHLAKYGHHTTVDRDCHNMRVAELLIERLINKNYAEHLHKEHDKRWGPFELRDDPWGCFLSRVGVITEWDKKQEYKEIKRIYQHEVLQQNQDLDLLFKHLRRHITKWWD
jgi:hypothetical protein